jgi:hypothetical protein
MALKQLSRIYISAITVALGLAALLPTAALADGNTDNPSPKPQNQQVTGVYVKNQFTLPVLQQPSSNAGFVSPTDDTVTQFALAAQYGNIGLLAHNHLAGSAFFSLTPGERVYVFYGSRHIDTYVITEVLQYQALDPNSPYSDFMDLSTGDILTANDLFHRVYMGNPHMTFQTCIAKDGNASWGRLFVIAELVVTQ